MPQGIIGGSSVKPSDRLLTQDVRGIGRGVKVDTRYFEEYSLILLQVDIFASGQAPIAMLCFNGIGTSIGYVLQDAIFVKEPTYIVI